MNLVAIDPALSKPSGVVFVRDGRVEFRATFKQSTKAKGMARRTTLTGGFTHFVLSTLGQLKAEYGVCRCIVEGPWNTDGSTPPGFKVASPTNLAAGLAFGVAYSLGYFVEFVPQACWTRYKKQQLYKTFKKWETLDTDDERAAASMAAWFLAKESECR